MDRTAPPETLERLPPGGRAQHCPAPPGRAVLPTERPPTFLLLASLLPLLLSAACSTTRPVLLRPSGISGPSAERGMASWYGPGFNGHRTASGERYNMNRLTAAHRNLPFGTLVEVRNMESGQVVVVRINDRGPFARGRVIDLSYEAAREVGVFDPGTAAVELRVVGEDLPDLRYTVQVGAFSDANLAVALHRDIKRIYPEAFVHSDGTWNRVQVGLFEDRDNAESLRRELAAMGITAVVVAAH
ncbi:MAG TPA: septal ring lytic transglycosylase RlpA family protein [Thermoanaerobaculia bacterium]|nr:septal ring lytic transglycosylase RlpA family protein [Thermoanaerobaculia bacterium]